MELNLIEQPMLFELLTHERKRELRAVNWYVEISDDVRNRPDMILMRVRQNDATDQPLVLLQVSGVRDDDVNAEKLLLREHQSGIDDNDVVGGAHDEHVHSELAQPAERDGPY